MKKIFFLLQFILMFSVYPQQITEMKKQQWINMLKDSSEALFAIDSIKTFKIIDALPVIETEIWKYNEKIQGYFIETIGFFKSQNTILITNKILDTIRIKPQKYQTEMNPDPDFSMLNQKIAEALFHVSNYSKREIVFNRVIEGDTSPIIMSLIDTLIFRHDVPLAFKNEAKIILLGVVNNKSIYDSSDRLMALHSLIKGFGSEIHPILKSNIKNENERWFVYGALNLLIESNYSDIISFIYECVQSSNNIKIKILFYKTLLRKYYSPVVINWIKERLKFENDLAAKDLLIRDINYYGVLRPAFNIKTILILDTLNSYHTQCTSFNWLGNQSFSNGLKTYLTEAKTKLSSGDSIGTAIKIKQYQRQIAEQYKDTLKTDGKYVTEDGYKFLYYYPKYILERLPKLFIEEISPSITITNAGSFTLTVKGSGFTKTSTLKWNGKTRTTTVISDTLLTAQILSTDVAAESKNIVTISSGQKETNSLTFTVYAALPKPITPIMECIEVIDSKKYKAWFGYENQNEGEVYLPVNEQNKVTPPPFAQTQPTVFKQGRQVKVFSVESEVNAIVWKLLNTSVNANKNSTRCK